MVRGLEWWWWWLNVVVEWFWEMQNGCVWDVVYTTVASSFLMLAGTILDDILECRCYDACMKCHECFGSCGDASILGSVW